MVIVVQNENFGKRTPVDPWVVDPEWSGETVVCIASGPSLTQQQVDHVRGKAKVIAINDNYRMAPWADMVYACDYKWWSWHYTKLENYAGRKVTQDAEAAWEFGLTWIPSRKGGALSPNPTYIHQGRNSGFQSINIAYLMGAERVLLLGYDMRTDEEHPRWFGHHPDGVVPIYEKYIEHFGYIADQGAVEVINCTPGSAIECFPTASIFDVI